MRKINILFIVFLLPIITLSRTTVIEGKINWKDNLISKLDKGNNQEYLCFDGVKYDDSKNYLGIFSRKIKLNQEKINHVAVVNIEFENIDEASIRNILGKKYIKSDIDLSFLNAISQKNNYGIITFTPIVYDSQNGTYKRVVSFKLEVTSEKQTSLFSSSYNKKNKSFIANSVLQSGSWYKIAILKDGVFKLSYSFLKDLGMDIDNINPQDIKVYGNGGEMLPELNSLYRYDDLKQNAIYVEGEVDASFDKNDFILFYGQSPNKWTYNASRFEHQLNKYSDTTYYFITASNTSETPKRISTQSSLSIPTLTVTSFDDYAYYEKDWINLIKSGDKWYGEKFDIKKDYDFTFNFPNIDIGTSAFIQVAGVGRSEGGSNLKTTIGSNSFTTSFLGVNISCHYCAFVDFGSASTTFTVSSDLIPINIAYNKPSQQSIAWLDEIEVNVRRKLIMNGNQLFYRDVQSVGVGNVSEFILLNSTDVAKIWDITDPANIKEQIYNLSGTTITYSLTTDSLREFVALTDNYETSVFAIGEVSNQNLHGLSQTDMIIVSHPDFLTQADQVADFHRDEGLSVIVVTPQQVYNEFSSGSQDLVAIRDFMRMFYERSVSSSDLPKYLLFFGDGSYDNKNRIQGNTNFIPTYQSANSFASISSYTSDDYYGLLDSNEGEWSSGAELVDIGIGRLPVKTVEEAINVTNKILNYNTPNSMADWRNEVAFIADDEDGNTHMAQANSLAGMVEAGYPSDNVKKIFLDAYKQESTPGGSRYPDAKKAFNDQVEEGALIINYTGHGGEVGWAHEQVLDVPSINNWSNTKNLPLFVTATCEFSRFDDPARTSAGELVLLNKGGGIGLLTTVRLVFSNPNFALNQSFYNHVFKNKSQRLGDIFTVVKIENGANSNTRNFTLLGDPALRLNYPKHDVSTTKINGVNVTLSDTIRGLQKVTIEGYVQDTNGIKLTNFNGIINPTVFDKEKQIATLNNDGDGVFNFTTQTSKLFKGKASVQNGDFSFTFVVPKDISINYGKGKLSYYAENQVEDASGYHTDFYIGGTASSYALDNTGPNMDLYMNDENFVFGGITDENPVLLANINDSNGINMVGNGIGHDIMAVLDNNTKEAFVLNDYYEADLNSYQSGKIKFPFKDLEEGLHTLTVKVWDVYNNSSEATIEFTVVKSKEIMISRVYNYPNPFTTYTEFWFDHNQPNKQMYAQVQIFTVSGKLVKTLEKNIITEGFRSTSITWNGLDDYGDRIARGVYVYRLKIRSENLSIAEKYEKLVILR